MLQSAQFAIFISALRRHAASHETMADFDLEWMGGRFGIVEACGAQLYVGEQAPDSVAAVELVAEPQLMCLLIDFEEAGRKPSPMVESKRIDANSVLELISEELKIGQPLVEIAALVKRATALVHEGSGDVTARLFTGNDGIMCLFRFHKQRLASVLVADMRQLPGFACPTTDEAWFMKAVNFLWEGPGTCV